MPNATAEKAHQKKTTKTAETCVNSHKNKKKTSTRLFHIFKSQVLLYCLKYATYSFVLTNDKRKPPKSSA